MSAAPKIQPLKGKAAKLAAKVGKTVDNSVGVRKNGHAPKAPAPKVPDYLVGVTPAENVRKIPLGLIERDPLQPRKEFDPEEIAATAETLKAHGQLQPIRVFLDKQTGRYRIIAGECRWRAAGQAGLKELTCIVEEDVSKIDVRVVQLVENCARHDLKPLELAHALDELAKRPGWTQRHVAKTVGLTPAAVTRALALLELPKSVKTMVEAGSVAPSTAYELSKLDDPEDQRRLAEQAALGVPHVAIVDRVKAIREPKTDPVPALPPVPADPKPTPLQVATSKPAQRPESGMPSAATPTPPTARYSAEELGLTEADLDGAYSGMSLAEARPKIRKVVRIGSVAYACVGMVKTGPYLDSATLCPITTLAKWEGQLFTDGRKPDPKHGYFGIVAAHGGTKYVLGHRESEVTLYFDRTKKAKAPGSIDPPPAPQAVATKPAAGIHWEENHGPGNPPTFVDVVGTDDEAGFDVAIQMGSNCTLSVVEILSRALQSACRKYGAYATFPPGTRVQVTSGEDFDKGLVGAVGVVEDWPAHTNPDSVWVVVDWKGCKRHLPLSARSLQLLDAGKGGKA